MIRNRYPASSLRSREVGYLDENYQKLANAIILQAVKDFRAAYRRLKRFPNVISGYLPEIASGKRSSTEFDIPVKKLGFSKLTWTARELGLNSIFSGGRVTEEAKEAAIAKIAFNIATLNNALLEDYPYLLYWYDKTGGISRESTISGNGSSVSIVGNLRIRMWVAREYAIDDHRDRTCGR